VEEERKRTAELPIDSLIALAALRELKRVTAEELAARIQRDAGSAKRTLEALTEAGLVEAHGATRGRTYMLSAAVYGGWRTRRPTRGRRALRRFSTSRWC
jgi:ATP-dependent DNA helicase RecG